MLPVCDLIREMCFHCVRLSLSDLLDRDLALKMLLLLKLLSLIGSVYCNFSVLEAKFHWLGLISPLLTFPAEKHFQAILLGRKNQ